MKKSQVGSHLKFLSSNSLEKSLALNPRYPRETKGGESKDNKRWALNQDKSADVQEEVQDFSQVSMIASKERTEEYDDEPIDLVSNATRFPTLFPVKKKKGYGLTCTSFRFLNNALPLPKGETYELEEASTEKDCDIAQVNCVTIEEEK